MGDRIQEWKPTIVEQIELAADETLNDFVDRLSAAVKDFLEPDGPWGIEAIGEGWLVAMVVDRSSEELKVDRFRITWQKSGDEFSFGAAEKVKRKVVFEPDRRRETPTPPAEEGAKFLDVGDLTESHGPGTRFKFDALRDTFLVENVQVFERDEGQVREAAPFQVLDEDFTSPTGEPYIAVLVGYGAADSIININERLYDPEGEEGQPGMRKNVAEQKAMIEAAFRDKRASMGSELDHPRADEGPTFKGLATELIDVRQDGERVAIKEGVMDTSEGRNLMVAAAHGFPIGKSTLARGMGERRIMDKDNPFFGQNPEHEGKVYNHIFGFVIEQYDTVRHPSARVFVQMHRAEVSREVQEAFDSLICEDGSCPVEGRCADGSEPKREVAQPRCITNPETQDNPDQEIEMNEDQVKQMIAEAVAEKDAELKATVDELSEKQAATETALTETQGKLAETQVNLENAVKANSDLKDELQDARAVADVAKAKAEVMTAERDAATLGTQMHDAAKAHVAEKEELEFVKVKRQQYIEDRFDRFESPVLKDDEGKARAATHDEMVEAVKAHVEASSERFDRVMGSDLTEIAEAANRRKVNDKDADVRHEASQGYAHDPFPVALTSIPTKDKPSA